jgi:hypothetical protein
MKLTSALAGLAILGGIALSGTAASAMPIATPGLASPTSNVQQADYVCNPWHCWNRPFVGEGYYHPHYYGGWGWHRGWGNGWHHWHHGWGYGGWHRWHHWHHGWGYGGGWHRWHHWHGW